MQDKLLPNVIIKEKHELINELVVVHAHTLLYAARDIYYSRLKI